MSEVENPVIALWELHMQAEFAHRSVEEALATMTSNPHVTLVPTMMGGKGREGVGHFYGNHFLNQLPPDIEIVPVSRTVGKDRLVDEMVIRFTHSIQMDWVLPGVPPTGKRIEIAMVGVIYVEDGKIAAEHLYYDNATVLRQAGLLPDPALPVLGAESARQVLDQSAPYNELAQRGRR